jgi:hypothetical protein
VLEAEVERLDALPLPLLGTEVMTAAFGPGRDHDDDVWVHWDLAPRSDLWSSGACNPRRTTIFNRGSFGS